MLEPGTYPPTYQDLAERFGAPVPVEAARAGWGAIVARAEAGAVTLIAREDRAPNGWAAVVPLSEVAGPARCPVWPLTEARDRLGEVIDAATRLPVLAPQILTRHRQPAAAVLDARALYGTPDAAERIDMQAIIEEGGTVTLEYEPGESGAVDEDGIVTNEPVDPAFVATARRWDGTVAGYGTGDTLADAMLRIRRAVPPSAGGGNEDPWASDAGYSDEPPF